MPGVDNVSADPRFRCTVRSIFFLTTMVAVAIAFWRSVDLYVVLFLSQLQSFVVFRHRKTIFRLGRLRIPIYLVSLYLMYVGLLGPICGLLHTSLETRRHPHMWMWTVDTYLYLPILPIGMVEQLELFVLEYISKWELVL